MGLLTWVKNSYRITSGIHQGLGAHSVSGGRVDVMHSRTAKIQGNTAYACVQSKERRHEDER